jgi:hypothetical protein
MKKPMKKVGEGEFENNHLKRIISQQEEEHLADEEIAEYVRRHLLELEEVEDDTKGI